MEKSQRKTVKTQKAVAFLRQQVKTARRNGSSRLPPISVLAKKSGVSVVTMHRAVDLLKVEQKLTVSPRSGIHIVKEDEKSLYQVERPPSDPPLFFGKKWQRIRRWILDDIRDRIFPPGSLLPMKKELLLRYGTCSSTLTKALQALVHEEKIVPFKRRFKVFKPLSLQSNGTMVIISMTDIMSQISSFSPILHDFFTSIEQQQQVMHFSLKMIGYGTIFSQTQEEIQNHLSIKDIERLYSVIGYIVITNSLQHEKIVALVDVLRTVQKPVVIFDDIDICSLYPRTYTAPYLRIFKTANNSRSSGKAVGNYLFAKGHRNVAFFSFSPLPRWAQLRIDGIAHAMTVDVKSNPVHCFLCDTPHDQNEKNKEMRDNMEGFIKSYDPSMINLELLYYLRKYSSQWELSLTLRNNMYHQFHRALQNRSVTAWIGANDTIALYAHFFLQQYGISKSRPIALVGFDNTFDSFAHGISSYNFNCAAAVQAILEYLFSPISKTKRHKSDPVEIPGVVIERESSALGKK